MADPTPTTPPTYRIKNVLDFAAVPSDRRDICLKEFKVWLAMNVGGRSLLSGLPVKWPDEFVWIDDDKNTVSMSVSTPTGERIPLASCVIKEF